jgi:hypothetical protein
MDPKDTTDPFAKYGAKADEDPFAKYGAKADEPEAPAPIQAAQTSISQAFNKTAANQRGLLSKATEAGLFGLADIGSGAVAGAPFGLGPSVLGALPGTSTEEVEQDIAAAKKRSPVLFGVGEFGSELATSFLPGAAAGEFLAAKAGPALTRAFPVLSRAPGVLEAALKGLGLGTVTGGEAAGRAVVEGAPVEEALKAGAETGGSMMLMPLGFQAAPALAKVAPQAVRAGIEKVPSYLRNLVPEVVSSPVAATGRAVEATSRFLAPAVAPVGLAYESMPSKDASKSEWTKWALNQGVLAGGIAGEGFEKLAAKSRESIQPKLRRATAEGMELSRGDIYGQEARREVAMGQIQKAEQARQVQNEVTRRLEGQRRSNIEQQILEEQRKGEFKTREAEEVVRNRQFRAAVRGEQRAQGVAERMMQGDVSQFDKLAADALDLDTLVKGLGDGSDPALRGLLGKLFQDVSNRLLRAKQALANRPELANKTLVEKINTVDRLIEESYLKNTEKGGYLEDFNDDPYVRLEQERVKRLAAAQQKQDRLSFQQAELLNRINTRDYLKDARAKQQPPPALPEERVREIAEDAGLDYKGPDEQYGTQVRHPMKLSPASAVAPVGRDVALARKLEQKTRGQVLDEVLAERKLSVEPDIANVTGETKLQAAVRRLRSLPEGDRRRADLEAEVQGEFERQVAAGGRTLRGLAPEADYGEKPEFMNVMDVGRARAATETILPDWMKPSVAGRILAGPVRALAKAPESKFRETQGIREERRPAETTMEKPYSTVAMLRAWDKVLERPSEKTVGALARIADRLGITYDKLLKTTAYRAAALEQALKDPEVAKEVMSNVVRE